MALQGAIKWDTGPTQASLWASGVKGGARHAIEHTPNPTLKRLPCDEQPQ